MWMRSLLPLLLVTLASTPLLLLLSTNVTSPLILLPRVSILLLPRPPGASIRSLLRLKMELLVYLPQLLLSQPVPPKLSPPRYFLLNRCQRRARGDPLSVLQALTAANALSSNAMILQVA